MANKKQNKKKWFESTYKNAVEKRPERRSDFKTDSEIPIDPVYVPDDSFSYEHNLGFPGQFPYTRGVQPTMYRGRFWTMRQYAGFGSAEESNARFKYLLKSGTTGLSVAFDLPTQMGYDSDHKLAEGEVGKVGVPICSLQDMENLFCDIPLNKVSTSMTINSTAAILLAFYIAVAKKQNVDLKDLSGTVQNDILKEYIARGTYIYPPEPSMRIITDMFRFCNDELPRWNTISISGYHIREAGSDAIQELAFTFANAIAYVEAALQSGLDIDSFASRLSFFFNAHNHFFEEIAKFRAARRLWAGIMRDRFKATDERSLHLRFHTQTGGSTLTAQQPQNNIVRVTLQALAAILGGTQSLHTNSFDEALALPTEQSVRTALRTQQIIAYETGIADSIDPLGGSYFLENLTGEIEKRVVEYLIKIEEIGGAVEAIKSGYFQQEIARSAYLYQKQIEEGERISVGVNQFEIDEQIETEILKIDPATTSQQIESLRSFKESRDKGAISEALTQLENTAQSDQNLMPALIHCVEKKVTLGEISNCLQNVFGTYHEGNY
jgi:methylmalonyl-CoA mutase N-terminal domain/subunit